MADSTPEAVEVLARHMAGLAHPQVNEGYRRMTESRRIAQGILAEPGPLLAALAQAGVLEERHQIVCSCGSIRTGTWRPHDEADVHDMTRERCYVTEWKPVSGNE